MPDRRFVQSEDILTVAHMPRQETDGMKERVKFVWQFGAALRRGRPTRSGAWILKATFVCRTAIGAITLAIVDRVASVRALREGHTASRGNANITPRCASDAAVRASPASFGRGSRASLRAPSSPET